MDAYRLEIVDDTRQAAWLPVTWPYYRVAALLATAGALYFAGWFGNPTAATSMALGPGLPAVAMLMLPG